MPIEKSSQDKILQTLTEKWPSCSKCTNEISSLKYNRKPGVAPSNYTMASNHNSILWSKVDDASAWISGDDPISAREYAQHVSVLHIQACGKELGIYSRCSENCLDRVSPTIIIQNGKRSARCVVLIMLQICKLLFVKFSCFCHWNYSCNLQAGTRTLLLTEVQKESEAWWRRESLGCFNSLRTWCSSW